MSKTKPPTVVGPWQIDTNTQFVLRQAPYVPPVLFRDKANDWLRARTFNKRYVVRKMFTEFNSSEESNFLCDKWVGKYEDEKIIADLGWNFDASKLVEIFEKLSLNERT